MCVYNPNVCIAWWEVELGESIEALGSIRWQLKRDLDSKEEKSEELYPRFFTELHTLTVAGMYTPPHTQWTCMHFINIHIVHTNHLWLNHSGTDSKKTIFTSKYLKLLAMALVLHSSCTYTVLYFPPVKKTHVIDSLVKNKDKRTICEMLH